MKAFTVFTRDRSFVSQNIRVFNKIDKAPRSRSKKARRYEHVDLTKEFEIRRDKREAEKVQKLNELYEKHDKRALELKGLTPIVEAPKGSEQSEI